MSEFSRTRMAYAWRDPLRGLAHTVTRFVSQPMPGGISHVWYETWCGHRLTVDDINARTMAVVEPDCLRCVVATPILDVVKGKE